MIFIREIPIFLKKNKIIEKIKNLMKCEYNYK